MIECPWCNKNVEVYDNICPNCKQEVLPDQELHNTDVYTNHLSIQDMIQDKFKCAKCKCEECRIKEVAMTGTGLSKMFDIQHNHYLFVSCMNCGYVEMYDPEVLEGKKTGKLGTVLDILFGG
ncbi:zinc ribbon domain-containing protein [Paenibacillus sp. N1-5-1-14]|uniref:zinc ribbon domain-containing protein n=1 Tax=Paenibacillus radicibacter TaxID=2972488 RepID=UPI0021595A59|nr:zinc ribbon domain-containing protein [Paenibacillus radicibacter]MCR8644468.1 zinc ribbon domain-containing protein [Paenibacillus radicibacter]